MGLTSLVRAYERYGWSLVPVHSPVGGGCTCGRDSCDTPGKHPRGPWRQFHERRPTREELKDWLDSYDPLNIGIVTGRVSGLVVIDVDLPDPDLVIDDLGLPTDTLTAITGGGGRHYFYTCGQKVKGTTGWVPGVDIRAEGNFVVAPPSLHESGNRYKWEQKVEPVPFPLEMLARTPVGKSEKAHPEEPWYLELLAGVGEGTRSASAARLAGRYATLGLAPIETRMLLAVWNELNEPPLLKHELRGTIESIYRRHGESSLEQITTSKELRDMLASWNRKRG